MVFKLKILGRQKFSKKVFTNCESIKRLLSFDYKSSTVTKQQQKYNKKYALPTKIKFSTSY